MDPDPITLAPFHVAMSRTLRLEPLWRLELWHREAMIRELVLIQNDKETLPQTNLLAQHVANVPLVSADQRKSAARV